MAASPAVTVTPPAPGRGGPGGAAVPRGLRYANRSLAIAGTAVIWLALLGPVIALLTHLSWNSITTSLSAPGAFEPLVLSVESGAVTLGVLLLLGTPLAWALARGTLPFPRVWEAGVLAALLLPPLVIGLLLVFMVGPFTPIGHLLSGLNLSATDTFLALVIAQVYESAPMALAIAWARAMGAFGAVVIIAYHPTALPLQIWTSLQETGLPSALPFALVLLVVALPLPIAAYIWSARARGRRRG